VGEMPEFVKEPFATAMSQSIWLPAAVLLIGFLASVCFARPLREKKPGVSAGDAASRETSLQG